MDAEAGARETLTEEPPRQRASPEQSLTETRGLLARRETALDEERSPAAVLAERSVSVDERPIW
jgi:hypothetical protein